MRLEFDRDWPEREPIRKAFTAALAAVDPERVVRTALGPGHEVACVVAIGKAATGMARGVPQPASGLVVSSQGEAAPDGFRVLVGAHPQPDARSVSAGKAVLEYLSATTGPVLFLISGGASALCEVPPDGISIEQVGEVTWALLQSGADITELNTVRKHLSQIKGGQLVERIGSRPSRTLVLSDVVGDPIDVIASGLTVPDASTYDEAREILARYQIEVPEPVSDHLAAGSRGEIRETPALLEGDHSVEVVANGAVAAKAAAEAAIDDGIPARVASTLLSGEAGSAALETLDSATLPGMTFSAGETTVEVTGSGSGGRNQHAALAGAIILEGGDETMFATLATDGIDGNVAAAGAIVDGGTVRRGRRAGLDAREHLINHDSHTLLAAAQDLLWLGPTGTNVADLWVVWKT